ncbi:MAG: SPASM domain-containing protein [Patescibacteria group bacterium]|nr:SPASM domain-containing protein [Patescibacteria group bacterium]
MTPYSELRKQPRIPLVQAVPLPAPLTLYVEMTNRCNFACKMCPESLPGYKDAVGGIRTMELDDMRLVRDRVREVGGVKVLHLHVLGEPMLNRHTPDFVKMMRPLAERIILTTNGSVSMVDLLDCPPDYVRVSVYGTDDDQFAQVTGKRMLNRVRLNVRSLVVARDDRVMERPHVYVKAFGDGGDALRDQFASADEFAVEPLMDWDGRAGVGSSTPGTRRSCAMPFYTLAVHADLKVSPCCVDWSKRLVVGDLREQSIGEIWRGMPLEALRLQHLSGKRTATGCKDCSYLNTLPDDVDSLDAGEYVSRASKRLELATA